MHAAMAYPRISSDPAVMMGKPCIKGTRITVELVLRELGAGHSFADLLDAHPNLTEEDLRAALAFAADYMQSETGLRDLSLSARLAVALECFTRYCRRCGLAHAELSAFVDYLWEFPVVISNCTPETFVQWEQGGPSLLDVRPSDPLPPGIEAAVLRAGLSPQEFRDLLFHVVQIVWGSFYAASDDFGSLSHLKNVIRITRAAGVFPPDYALYSSSRFADGGGWGARMTPEQRDEWRRAGGAAPA
jgi:uncharacterized protein (DUF433 family)